MGRMIELKAADGATISAYVAEPKSKAIGGLVVCQEIFGVNSHIRSVTDAYAEAGYFSVAPALFDRVQKGVEFEYDQDSIAKGVDIMKKSPLDIAMFDVTAAASLASSAGRVGIVGYCWGGTVAWAAACRRAEISASVAYYGGGIGQIINEKPGCPLIGHFGRRDKSISMDTVEKIKLAHPDIPIHIYDAEHGFNCNERATFNAEAAALARVRSINFLAKHLA